jgi:phosphoribosyl 1,2-cyclic phosphodiesterase
LNFAVFQINFCFKYTQTEKNNQMRTGITALGSGSKGNSILLHTENSGILIDVGFSRKETLTRLEILGISPEIINGILITHEHDDHVRGCRVLANHLDLPTYLTVDTFKYLHQQKKIGDKKIIFAPGSPFEVNKFKIDPFSVQHDAIQPVGFIVTSGRFKIGIATDLGQLNRLATARLQGCDALILEANHDVQMLRDAMRPLHLKRRILGRHGHLSNEDAIEAFSELLSGKTRHVFLAHISSECNDHNLVKNLAKEKLKKMGRADILLYVLEQSKPLKTVWLD